ncbi:cyclodeaminase [Oceaniradius stylonematis]|uniref:cyclodeaminase n=1 Tax=Oceaniradius stylonematis TaxID=2184161 RepID=UPI0027402DCB|nr:cyclodeaminase [Oceaniradius stylonematis]
MPRDIQIITEPQLRKIIALDRVLVDVVERAFSALAEGHVVMPPVLSMDLPMVHGEVDVKTAYIPGFDGFAIKVSPGFFNNPKLGLPSLNGLMVLLSAKTGLVEAVYLDNGYLTELRTAAAGAVAARHLAPSTVDTAGVVGTGIQARLQMQAAFLERPFRRGLVWGRDTDKADACAKDLTAALGVPFSATTSVADLVARAQFVVTTTPSREPLITADMLHPGLHITAMGSDQAGKNEIAPRVLAAIDAYACDSQSQCAALGELRAAIDAGAWADHKAIELGEIVLGKKAGREQPNDVTLCDLTGTGAQDTAIACHVRMAFPDAGQSIPISTGTS